MNGTRYEAIAQACDKLLLAPETTVERVAISWLHVLNEHPINLAKYGKLRAGSPDGRNPFQSIRRSVAAARNVIMSRGNTASSVRPTGSGDVLFVSHLLSESHAGDDVDFYFGHLPATLVQQLLGHQST